MTKWQFEDYWKGQAKTVTYRYSGAAQDFVVPDSVTSVEVKLRGGIGGGENIDRVPGGGYMVVEIPVTPGETLRVRVGGSGPRVIPGATGATGGFNGGGNAGNGLNTSHTGGYGGGGASDVRQGGDTLADRVVVAGGGGGNSGESISHAGGVGGGDVGGDGVGGNDNNQPPNFYGGKGGTLTAGGAAGTGGSATAGALGVGGQGGNNTTRNGGGGGGGGEFGGGGGGHGLSDGAGGGGGSNSAVNSVTVLHNAQGSLALNPEDPYIAITYTEALSDDDVYVWEVNANEGGSPAVVKNVAMSQNVGPNRNNILQEGQSQAPVISFSGVIITQSHYETLEYWFDKRILIKLTDDLGREFYGVFSQFTPKRERRQSHQWYHQYDAQFTLTAYKNASGNWVYGRID